MMDHETATVTGKEPIWMNESRNTATIVGVLFIIATVFLFIGEFFYAPILESPAYLTITYPNRTLVVFGILLEFACVLAIPLIAMFLYPVLRKHSEVLALGYVGFRLFEAVLFVSIEINKLSLIAVSQAHLERGGADASYFQVISNTTQALNEWTFSMYLLVFTIGALMLYSVLYKSRLVPRLISVWGLLAAMLLFTGTVLIMLDVLPDISGVVLELIFALPIALNEMVLAIWLIVKGFNPSALQHGEARTTLA
ncbi:DUF4386 domain-containing protein [Haloferax sp. DFSO52]|uniref:DUF4386 domain-containing protein n=1 Tax=Haloferax sp. DFSO52 TaxID=3388505 RepID=UPI003A8421C6